MCNKESIDITAIAIMHDEFISEYNLMIGFQL